jgi:hypothetical protein
VSLPNDTGRSVNPKVYQLLSPNQSHGYPWCWRHNERKEVSWNVCHTLASHGPDLPVPPAALDIPLPVIAALKFRGAG